MKPGILLDTYNACVRVNSLPERWKTARLVLLYKGYEKPTEEPSSYKPLCMLDSAGKLLELMILQRINQRLDETGQRADSIRFPE